MEKKQFNVYLEKNLIKKLKNKAIALEMTYSEYIEFLILKDLKDLKD